MGLIILGLIYIFTHYTNLMCNYFHPCRCSFQPRFCEQLQGILQTIYYELESAIVYDCFADGYKQELYSLCCKPTYASLVVPNQLNIGRPLQLEFGAEAIYRKTNEVKHVNSSFDGLLPWSSEGPQPSVYMVHVFTNFAEDRYLNHNQLRHPLFPS